MKEGRLADHAHPPEAARADLLERKLFATKLEPATAVATPAETRISGKLKPSALVLFTRQLATLASVAPLEEALRTIVRQTESDRSRAVLASVHGAVVEGRR